MIKRLKSRAKHYMAVTPRDPLLLDRWVDVAYCFYWASYALWGLITLISGIPTIEDATSSLYQFMWAGGIGTLSSVAGLACISYFFKLPKIPQIAKKYTEYAASAALAFFVVVYPFLLISASMAGDRTRDAAAALSISYLVFIILRVHILRSRIRALKAAQETARKNLVIDNDGS